MTHWSIIINTVANLKCAVKTNLKLAVTVESVRINKQINLINILTIHEQYNGS